jgi:hypothetical protein
MPRKLKVYGGNFDGTHHDVVAAYNQQEAARLLHITVGGLRSYGGVWNGEPAASLALGSPGTVWRKRYYRRDGTINDDNDDWSVRPY